MGIKKLDLMQDFKIPEVTTTPGELSAQGELIPVKIKKPKPESKKITTEIPEKGTEGIDPRLYGMVKQVLPEAGEVGVPEVTNPTIPSFTQGDQRSTDFFSTLFRNARRQAQMSPAQASNIMAISEDLGISPHEVQENYRELTRGLSDQPTPLEVTEGLMQLGLAAGLLTHPVNTALAVGGFMAIDQVGKLENLAPMGSIQTRDLLKIADFTLKGAAVGAVVKGVKGFKSKSAVQDQRLSELQTLTEDLRESPNDPQVKSVLVNNLEQMQAEEAEILGLIKDVNREKLLGALKKIKKIKELKIEDVVKEDVVKEVEVKPEVKVEPEPELEMLPSKIERSIEEPVKVKPKVEMQENPQQEVMDLGRQAINAIEQNDLQSIIKLENQVLVANQQLKPEQFPTDTDFVDFSYKAEFLLAELRKKKKQLEAVTEVKPEEKLPNNVPEGLAEQVKIITRPDGKPFGRRGNAETYMTQHNIDGVIVQDPVTNKFLIKTDNYYEGVTTLKDDPGVIQDFLTLIKTDPNTLGTGLGPIGDMTPEKIAAFERLKKRVSRIIKAAKKSDKDVETYLSDLGMDKESAKQYAEFVKEEVKNGVTEDDGVLIDKGNLPLEGQEHKIFNEVLSKLDIEHPFKKINAPELGFHIKNYYTLRSFHEDQGLNLIKDLTKFKLSPEDYSDLSLLRERTLKLEDLPAERQVKLRDAHKLIDDYLETSFKEYKDEGGLEEPFPKSLILRLGAKNKILKERLKTLKVPKDVKRVRDRIQKNNDAIDLLKGTKYVPILTSWYSNIARSNPAKFNKMVKIAAQSKRKTLTLKELLDNEFITPEQADIRNLIASYARRKGKDIATLRIRNAGVKEGAIVPLSDKSKKWSQFAYQRAPVFKGFKVRPGVDQFLHNYLLGQDDPSLLGRTLGTIKGLQFINPFLMPMYNLYQNGMLGVLTSLKGPSSFKKAIKSVLTNDQHMIDAFENGLPSQPFNNPMNSYNNMVRLAKMPLSKRTFNLINPFVKENVLGLKSVYNASWSTAWMLDRVTRMASYHYLLEKGATPREAAQLAALYHSDYASVPPKTRRALNKVFFTPTFKITMTKLMAKTIAEGIKTPLDPKLLIGKDVKSKRVRLALKTLVAITAFNAGRDMFMQSQGFESDEWGRKYTKTVDTEEGDKEIVLTFSDPTNMHLKYLYRLRNALKPGSDTAWWSMIRSNKFEFHPVWRILAFDLAENRSADNKQIYSPGDNKLIKAGKISKYLTIQMIRLLAVFEPTGDDKETNKQLQKEFGNITSKLMKPFTFAYLRRTIGVRNARKIQEVKQQIMRDAREGILTEQILNNYQEQLKLLESEIKD